MAVAVGKIRFWPVKQHSAPAVQGDSDVFHRLVWHLRVFKEHPVLVHLYRRVPQIINQRGERKLQIPVAVDVLGKVYAPPYTVLVHFHVGKTGSRRGKSKTGQRRQYVNVLSSEGVRRFQYSV